MTLGGLEKGAESEMEDMVDMLHINSRQSTRLLHLISDFAHGTFSSHNTALCIHWHAMPCHAMAAGTQLARDHNKQITERSTQKDIAPHILICYVHLC